MSFKKGDSIIQILPAPIMGVVAGFSLDQDTGEVLVLMSSVDADGVEHTRYFKQTEIELNTVTPPAV